MKRQRFRERFRRGRQGGRPREFPVHILPNLFTTGNIFCGFFAVLKAFSGDFTGAVYFIFIAGLFDLVDGRIARMTNSQSSFGMEYDSICDVVSFGMAPAITVYLWGLQSVGGLVGGLGGRIGALVAFLYLACGAMRLARFNVQAIRGENEKGYFRGLPIPMAAYTVASCILFHHELEIEPKNQWALLAGLVLVAYFMVSSIRFASFKDFDFKSPGAFSRLVVAVVVLIAVAVRPELMLFCVIMTYISINVLRHLWGLAFKRQSESQQMLQPSQSEPPPGSH